jgi:hypothetical protein
MFYFKKRHAVALVSAATCFMLTATFSVATAASATPATARYSEHNVTSIHNFKKDRNNHWDRNKYDDDDRRRGSSCGGDRGRWWDREEPSTPPTDTPTEPSEPPVEEPTEPSEPPVEEPTEPSEPPVEEPTNPSEPSGTDMPVGDLDGWTQTFTEDFTTDLAEGSFPGSYGNKWLSYDGFTDTSKNGDYDQSILSVHDGTLDMHLQTIDGRPKGAAPVPLVDGQWGGQTYGKFSVRMKSDPVAGYGTGFLLWSDAEDWNQGEIDFPEGELSGTASGYNHCVGNPSSNCYIADTDARYADWHVYTINWTPDKLEFLVDDEVVGSTTESIPTDPMHWVMQVGTNGIPDADASGHLLIDWATIYTYNP